jgi:hypothetical protein
VAVAAPALLWVILALGVATEAGWLASIDGPVGALGNSLDANPVLHGVAVALGIAFSNWTTGLLLTAAAVAAVIGREYRIAAWAAVSGLVVIAGNPLIKHLFDRPASWRRSPSS